jgi:hypothetical protein
MRTPKLIDQLELYSNAIVAFVVAQCVGFAFAFGTNQTFACTIILEKFLAYSLAFHFVFSTSLAAVALTYISASIRRLSHENQNLVRTIFLAKIVAVVLFAVLPVGLLLKYGVPNTLDRSEAGQRSVAAGVSRSKPRLWLRQARWRKVMFPRYDVFFFGGW